MRQAWRVILNERRKHIGWKPIREETTQGDQYRWEDRHYIETDLKETGCEN